MINNISDDLKKIVLAGIGAVAATTEKSKQVLDELVRKGEITVEQGKVLNEELKRNIKSSIINQPDKQDKEVQDTNQSNEDPSAASIPHTKVLSIARQLEKLSKEDLAAVKAKLAELERTNADGETGKQY
ncbi:poly(hydroxyalkanoate) granule associated protein phasin [Ruminiclostridium sufflavum DSM 19573]|uniref:Poly(Hydroxyalkanoate) granule associated protein phasin n=2 Tax=Ruminiclostridium TaxID=1508657 RepID=A0A318XQQ9_9FIRM|nr:poly(hydroxyalkanoate) granule associated protein phasin [Ruminiclostridium sufflavum DSM 19573]